MCSESNKNGRHNRASAEIRSALAALLSAFHCAQDTESDRWDFAISIRRMCKLGLTETDLRWLVRKGYVEHAREVTVPGDDGRAFRSTGNLTFSRKTCFVLTESGVATTRSVDQTKVMEPSSNQQPVVSGDNGQSAESPVVQWDADMRKLRVDGQLVKRFKWPAANQEAILNAFQEEGWPERIDDPLPPHPEQDSKRRLSDTIKCLNRKQANALIHFRGDGTGEGVVWEIVRPDSEANGNG